MLAVVDLGVGNVGSLSSALRFIGAPHEVTSDPDVVANAEAVILPGVGAITPAVARLDEIGLRAPLHRHVDLGRPVLGVCLGMQLLLEGSEEGEGEGLGLLPGRCLRLGAGTDVKVPHVGFDRVDYPTGSWLHTELGTSADYYFTHSYAVRQVTGAVVGACDYDGGFVAVMERWPVVGVQFHPEKSQTSGLRLLSAFVRRARFDR